MDTDHAKALLDGLSLTDENYSVLTTLLQTVPAQAADEWRDSMCIRDGKVGGFYYEGIARSLSDEQLADLVEAIGWDREQLSTYQDYQCMSGDCVSRRGYLCNPAYC